MIACAKDGGRSAGASVAVYKSMMEMSRHGGFGDPSLATAQKGEHFLDVIVNGLGGLCEDLLGTHLRCVAYEPTINLFVDPRRSIHGRYCLFSQCSSRSNSYLYCGIGDLTPTRKK
jgi:hypothetical protein